MYGNALGWRISAILFIVAVGGGFALRSQMEITGPTALSLDQKNLAQLTPPFPTGILSQDQAGDAGDKYSAASGMFLDDSQACDDYSAKPRGPLPPPMQMVIDATRMSEMDLFLKSPADLIDYRSAHPPLDALSKLGQEMESAALRLSRAGKKDDARTFLLATYALGTNLIRERASYDEYSAGLGLMDGSLEGLSELEKVGSPAAQALSDQENALVGFDQQSVEPVYSILSSADPNRIAGNAGDVYRLALQSKERLFRVEAILKLGRYRFNAARPADQLGVGRFLKVLAADPDPAVRTAAAVAAGLTVEQYRMIH